MLTLPEPERELWERFVSRGRVLASHPVLTRWKRALSLGVAADVVAKPSGVDGVGLRERRERCDVLLEEGLPIVDPMASELGAHGLLALLTDDEGFILASRGGGSFVRRAEAARLVEGARWDEPERGTNAIGTAIAEAVPVCVVGRAHFERANHGLVCYASPVHDAAGRLVGVLNVSGPVEAHNPYAKLAVLASGRAIERALRARAFGEAVPGGIDVLTRLADRASTPTYVTGARGELLHRNEGARALGRAEGLDAVLEQLSCSSEARAREVDLGRRFVAHAEPLFARDGARIGTIVHLEPAQGRAPSRPPRARASAFDTIVGSDPAIVAAKAAAERFARTDLTVLLLAETGTGKELFARAIHAESPRKSGPFVAINCGAVTESLVASELFGYGPGAFTGARPQGQDGRFAAAAGGTLFLDEVAELPPSAQAALLRVLEDGTYSRVGENDVRRANVRIVCATCRDLPAMVESGAFRRDLYFRIKGAKVSLPPLRARGDVRELARELVAALSQGRAPSLLPEAEEALARYGFPGNVRELKTALTYALALSDGGPIGEEHLPDDIREATPPPEARVSPLPDRREGARATAERDALRAALDSARGNMSEAARQLGVARSTLYRMLVRHRIPAP